MVYVAKPPDKRFWNKVKFPSSVGTDECWEWLGLKHSKGYGLFGLRYKLRLAHRMAWELTTGAIPEGMCVCHTCDNPPCVNPSHLWLGTNADNTQDMMTKNRHGTITHPERWRRGEGHWKVKLTEDKVRVIRLRYALGGVSLASLAHEYGVCPSTIGRIVRRKIWTHI